MTIAIDFRDQDGERFLHVTAMLKSASDCDLFIRAMELSRRLLAPADEELPKFIGAGEEQRNTMGVTAGETAPKPKPPTKVVADKPLLPGQRLRQDLPQLWEGKLTTAEIAARYGLTYSRVSQIAKELGLPTRTSQLKPVDLNQAVADLWPTDATKREIADRLGVSMSTIGRIVSELGLPSRIHDPRRSADTNSGGESRERQYPASQNGKPEVPPAEGAQMLPPETAATAQEPASAPEPVEAVVVAAAAVPQNAPAVTPAPVNGHAPRGTLIVSTGGIQLCQRALGYDERWIDLSTLERSTLAVLLRAHPNPVGVEWIRRRTGHTEDALAFACTKLRKRLPEIGLELWTEKGVGMAIRVREAVAA